MKIGIVAGEKSGDYLASELIAAIKRREPEAQFVGLCGPLMQAQGAVTLGDMDTISIMGLEGLFSRIGEILSLRRRLLTQFLTERPDIFIGVDVPDFNLGLERKLRAKGIPCVHYVSPTVWAWRSGRVNKIKRSTDLMLTLFPFEEDFYQQHDMPVRYVGHPLAEKVSKWQLPVGFRESLLGDGETLVAVLPGSRMSEVSRLAPEMLAAAYKLAQERSGLRFVIPAANEKIYDYLQQKVESNNSSIVIIHGQSRDLLAAADIAILASGTAALEAALFATPMIVMYKVAWLSALVFGRTIRVTHFSMPNHLTKPPVVPELMQEHATAENLEKEVRKMLDDADYRENMRLQLSKIAPTLSTNAAEIAAQAIFELLDKKPC
jgi:lipid-A-disaccharide synthase